MAGVLRMGLGKKQKFAWTVRVVDFGHFMKNFNKVIEFWMIHVPLFLVFIFMIHAFTLSFFNFIAGLNLYFGTL